MISGDQLTEARHKLSAGRIIAIRMLPYFETTLMAMVTVEMPGFGKFTVDKRWRFYYDPELCLTMTTQEIAAEWIHNVEHIVRKHEERFAALEGHTHDHQKYNAAADGAINSDLREQGIIMPNPAQQFYAEPNEQFPMWKKNMSAEEMYFSSGGGGFNNSDPLESMTTPGESEDDNDFDEADESPEGAEKDNPGDSSDTEENDTDSSDDTNDSSPEEDAGSPSKGMDDTKGNGNPSKKGEDSNDPSQGGSEEDKAPSENDPQDVDDANSENSGSEGEDTENDSESGEPGDNGNTNDTENSSEDDEDGEEESDITLVQDEVVEGLQEIGSEDKPSDDTTSKDEEGDSSDSAGDSSDNESSTGDTNTKPLPDCGSAAGGPSREYESNDEDDGSVDDLSADTLLKETAEAIQAYAESNPGKVPGGLLREAKNILEPQIDWIDEFLSLLRAVTAKHSGYTNYSYTRPSRRSSGSAFILPVMRNPPAPEVAIILDTSGSMDEGKEIAMALAEMEEIINRVARFSETQSIKIINCDAASTEVAIIRDLKDFEIIGGGGTDMRVGIKAAAELKPRMDIIMTVTDGFTPWPKEVPSDNPYATYIALLVGSHSSKRANPPEWMTTIEVKIPQKRFGLKM